MPTEEFLFAPPDKRSEVLHAWGFDWRGKLDAAIRGALSFGFLGTALGGLICEKIFYIGYGPSEQWKYAVISSAMGAVIGIVWRSYHRPPK